MAASLPESTFAGIDLSPRQIEDATASVAALGLTIAFLAMDIREITPLSGHLTISSHTASIPGCRPRSGGLAQGLLAESGSGGIAYVSYNVCAGWHMLQGCVR